MIQAERGYSAQEAIDNEGTGEVREFAGDQAWVPLFEEVVVGQEEQGHGKEKELVSRFHGSTTVNSMDCSKFCRSSLQI